VKAIIGFLVRRPLAVNMVMFLFLAMGAVLLQGMKYENVPTINLDIYNITTFKPGASPEDVELSVTIPLEEEVLEVDGIRKLTSNSLEGMSIIKLTLDDDLDDKAQVVADVQKAIDRASTKLPDDLPQKPNLLEVSSLKIPVVEIHVSGTVSEETLRSVARKTANDIREIEGIAEVQKVGYRDREVRILLDPDKLHRLGISHGEIAAAIQGRNVRDSGGSLESFSAEKKILTVGKFDDPKDVEHVIIRSIGPNDHVELRDVAEVVLDYEDWQVQARTDGEFGIALQALKKPDADNIDAARAVSDYVEQARENLPPGVELSVVNDLSRFVVLMLETLVANALAGFVLVYLVLRLFFDRRLSFWVAAGIPVAICITFVIMTPAGLGINMLTITALILMLGMLVDDAIVTGESICSHQERGIEGPEAAVEGTLAVAAPVVVSALTTALAFAPLLAFGGLEGKFLRSIPFMVFFVLAGSLLECKFFLPAHLAHRSKSKAKPRQWFGKVRTLYGRWMKGVLRRRYLTIAIFVAGFVGLMALGAKTMRFNLYPDTEIDTFFVEVELEEGASFEKTGHKVAELEGIVRELVPPEEILNISTRIGHHDAWRYGDTEGRNPAWAVIAVYLTDDSIRETNSNEVMAALRERVKTLDGYRSIGIKPLKDEPPTGSPLQLEIISDGEERFDFADEVIEYLKEYDGVTEVESSYKPGKPIVKLELDHSLMAARGFTVADVTQAVRLAFDGLVVSELQTPSETIEYRLQFRGDERGKFDTLRDLELINRRGEVVPLRSFAELSVNAGEASIRHYGGQRTITVRADVDRAQLSVSELNAAVAAFIEDSDLMKEYPNVRLWYGGELEAQNNALGDVGMAFFVAGLAIFVVMVILFNSLSQPFLIMMVVPFGLTGVIVGFLLMDYEVSIVALVGILGLLGVLVNDSVVLIDSLNRIKRAKGGARFLTEEDVLRGSCDRLRPIIITSLTTVAGLFPTAYGILGENPFIAPMVMAMGWGVLFGVFVTPILLPCLYVAEQDLRGLFLRKPSASGARGEAP
jgi:multidrug efflux pump subunit AcrB